MIYVNGYQLNASSAEKYMKLTDAQKTIAKKLADSGEYNQYDTPHQLQFEIVMRSNIVAACYALKDSGASFATFRSSRCNPEFWQRTAYGGFMLRDDVSPASAINDIFLNGRRYGFECTTAIMILMYKAILSTIGDRVFNQLFGGLLLYSTEHDEDLQIMAYPDGDPMPGDVRYIINPEYNPATPQWQGENVIDLGNGMVFGHGIGVGSMQEIIEILNKRRRPDATVSAYPVKEIIRPNFRRMAEYIRNPIRRLLA